MIEFARAKVSVAQDANVLAVIAASFSKDDVNCSDQMTMQPEGGDIRYSGTAGVQSSTAGTLVPDGAIATITSETETKNVNISGVGGAVNVIFTLSNEQNVSKRQ